MPSPLPPSVPQVSPAPPVIHPGEWRRMAFHFSRVRPDDFPHRCPFCHRPVLVAQYVITQRSADLHTPRCYGPIEHMYHSGCWVKAGDQGFNLPPLGMNVDLWGRFKLGDEYHWAPQW